MKALTLIIGMTLLLSLVACDHEKNRIYTSRNEDECRTLQFSCVPGRAPFFDEKGCGCELIEEVEIETRSETYEFDRDDGEILPPQHDLRYEDNPNSNRGYENDREPNRIDQDPLERNLDQIQNERLDKKP
ncbi:MAG: hypothetical protein AB7J40_01375 [Candidatus Altimarinota bacterium]